MSRFTLIAGFAVVALAASPAFAQTTSAPAKVPAQGTVQRHHVMNPAPAHKMPKMKPVHPDMSADQLNAKELAAIQHGMSATPAAAPAPAAKP